MRESGPVFRMMPRDASINHENGCVLDPMLQTAYRNRSPK